MTNPLRTPIRSYSVRVAAWGWDMIVRFLEPDVFDPEAMAVMREAFDAACQELQDSGQPEIVLDRDAHCPDLRPFLGKGFPV